MLSRLRSGVWFSALGMPEAGDVRRGAVGTEAINDPMGLVNDFAGRGVMVVRHDSAGLRKIGKRLGAGAETCAESACAIRTVLGDAGTIASNSAIA